MGYREDSNCMEHPSVGSMKARAHQSGMRVSSPGKGEEEVGPQVSHRVPGHRGSPSLVLEARKERGGSS